MLAELEALEAGNDLELPEVPRTPLNTKDSNRVQATEPKQKQREKVTS